MLQALAIAPALGCLQTLGVIDDDNHVLLALSIDNGEVTCNSNWGTRIDQDNHISISCLPGYFYAIDNYFFSGSKGRTAWYGNGITAYTLAQKIQSSSYIHWWDDTNFGC